MIKYEFKSNLHQTILCLHLNSPKQMIKNDVLSNFSVGPHRKLGETDKKVSRDLKKGEERKLAFHCLAVRLKPSLPALFEKCSKFIADIYW